MKIGLGISPMFRRGGVDWSSYWKPLSLFFLDGTILDVAGTRYFVDKSANGRNFLITGYDFATDWTVGFPYKSAATISAPAGDAALIAADVNNFLYDAGGTPNQIPVVSLFEDVDYEHKIFCKHAAQVVYDVAVETATPGVYEDVEIETYEPRVSHVFMASDVLSGADLAKAYIDFGVPAEVTTNVKWVDNVNGLDTNDGSKAHPYKTLTKATSSVTNNTVYVKTGTYNDEVYAGSLYYWYIVKANTVIGLGLCSVTSGATNRVVFGVAANGATITIKNFIFDGEGTTDILFTGFTNTVTYSLESVYFKNIKTSSITTPAAGVGNYKYCIGDNATEVRNEHNGAATIDTCYFKNVWNRGIGDVSITYKNNKLINTIDDKYCVTCENGTIDFYDNDITSAGAGVSLSSGAMVEANDAKFRCNTFTVNDRASGTGAIYGIAILGTGSKYNVLIANNILTQPKTGALNSTNAIMFYVQDQIAPIIRHNIIRINGNNVLSAIYHSLSTVASGINKINYNTIITQSLTGAVLTIGYETGAANLADGSEIIGNYVEGYKKATPLATGTTHGILANCGINMVIKYNYVGYMAVGLAVKTGLQDTYTANGVFYNLLVDNSNSIWVRGIAGINVFSNTIRVTNTTYTNAFTNGIIADENSSLAGDQFSEDVIIKNNIIDVDVAVGNLVNLDVHAAANGCVVEHNVLSGAAHLLVAGATTYDDLATAQVAGWCAYCQVADPGLINLIPATPIVIGEDLGTDYDDGLDVVSTFGSSTAVPVITTKQQGAVWQAGAYIQ